MGVAEGCWCIELQSRAGTAWPEIKLQRVIEWEPGAPLGSDPCALPENEEKGLPVFL